MRKRILRKLDEVEERILTPEILKLINEKPEWFKQHRLEVEEGRKQGAKEQSISLTREDCDELMAWDNDEKKAVLYWDALCHSLAARFYASTRNNTSSNRVFLDFDDYLQEARLKVCELKARGVDEYQYKRSIVNHLKDYRKSTNKILVDFYTDVEDQ